MHSRLTHILARQHIADLHRAADPPSPRAGRHQQPRRPRTPPRRRRASPDMLPRVKEASKVAGERSINWCVVPAPHPAWATLVHPDLPADEAYEQLWCELEHVLRLDESDPLAAWDERMAVLNDYAARLAGHRFDAIELRGPELAWQLLAREAQ